jgi:hypothetical protein
MGDDNEVPSSEMNMEDTYSSLPTPTPMRPTLTKCDGGIAPAILLDLSQTSLESQTKPTRPCLALLWPYDAWSE